jgi:hypothetical protein
LGLLYGSHAAREGGKVDDGVGLFRHGRKLGVALLTFPHGGIGSAFGEQCAVPAAFDNLAFVQHQNFIGIDNGRQPVRDDQRGALRGNLSQGGLDFRLGVAV